ncbi:MAG: DEAD/DEAH box helicase [Theionarchaea archaeon]|nr:DEAD/DEAH box helicase [Theionarchaea archaeon]
MKIEDLRDLDVNDSVIKKIRELGFHELTEVQELAVEKGLFKGTSLIVSSPTNTGKTFIAELAALVASKKKGSRKTFYLTPLKAIAEEKFEEFEKKYSEWGMKIAISTSEHNVYDANLIDYDVVISTYEKLNSLVIRNSELIEDIGVVVVDELQMIGDEERGAKLEVLLTRLCKNDNSPQIIGLSATTPNVSEIAKWLEAEIVETETRDVELREGIIYSGEDPIKFRGHTIRKGDFLYKEFNSGSFGIEKELNVNTFKGLLSISEKEQMIIFENTRRKTEDLALKISEYLDLSTNITKWIGELNSRVENTPSTRRLKKCMKYGVAFHHAGLLREEKRIVQEAFENGDVRVICATLTLGAGVNTPAKNVIILSPTLFDGRSIRSRDYKNMAGRAGRIKYHDDFGRSVLFARNEKDLERFWHGYIEADVEKVESQVSKNRNLDFSILTLFASGICKDDISLTKFIEKTFFGNISYSRSNKRTRKSFNESISRQVQNLVNEDMLESENGKIKISELGKRCAEEMISPASGHIFFESLRDNKQRIEGLTDYADLIEPIIHLACCVPDAHLLFPPRYTQEKKELGAYWHVNKDNYLYKPSDKELFEVLRTVQMLLRWVDGVPYSDLVGFAPQGIIRGIGDNIGWLVESIKKIAEPPLFDFPEEFYETLTDLCVRLKFGVRENAMEIVKLRIPAIHRYRAMLLADAGFTSLESLVNARIEDLAKTKGIDNKLANGIKKYIDRFIFDKMKKRYNELIRRAKELGRDISIIERLFNEKNDSFSKACCDLIGQMGIRCEFIGDLDSHEPDCLIEWDNERFVIECKRKSKDKLVSAKEAEEIWGKGKKYTPSANITICYPDFTKEAIVNAKNTEVTLVPCSALAKILIRFWENELTKDEIIKLIKSRNYVSYESV